MGDLDQLTRNFHRREFACRGDCCCGHSAPINLTLVHGLQLLRDWVSLRAGRDVRIIVTSGFRCVTHDREVAQIVGKMVGADGGRRSQHCFGLAADIVVGGVDPDLVQSVAEEIGVFRRGGIGRYSGARADMIHLDVRTEGRARWTG